MRSLSGPAPGEAMKVVRSEMGAELAAFSAVLASGNPYFFIWFQAAALSFPMKTYGFKTIVFYREISFPVKKHGFKTMFFYRDFWRSP